MRKAVSPGVTGSPACVRASGIASAISARNATWPRRWRLAVPNLAANPQLLIYGIAGMAAIAMLLLGFGIYAVVTAPQARLKRRISSVVGDPLPALTLPGSARRDVNAAGKRKKQIQDRLKHAEEA